MCASAVLFLSFIEIIVVDPSFISGHYAVQKNISFTMVPLQRVSADFHVYSNASLSVALEYIWHELCGNFSSS
jgi:hypothetical protein